MNTELLLKVKAHILEEPRRLCMSEWIADVKPGSRIAFDYETTWQQPKFKELSAEEVPPCGTVGCIWGWSKMLSGKKDQYGNPEEILGLYWDELRSLFHPSDWDNEELAKEYASCGNAQRRAEIVGQIIDEFIAAHS